MSGLRSTSKQKRYRQVLGVAEGLFRDQGYENTTIDEISTASEVSIGTIYKYFGSKSGIMLALMLPVIEEMRSKGEAILANPPKRAPDAIAALFQAYRFTDDWAQANILQAFDPSFSRMDDNLNKVQEEFHDFLTQQFRDMLIKLQVGGRLKDTLDIDDATYLIYTLLTSAFSEHINPKIEQTYEEILVDAHRRLRLLFESWT